MFGVFFFVIKKQKSEIFCSKQKAAVTLIILCNLYTHVSVYLNETCYILSLRLSFQKIVLGIGIVMGFFPLFFGGGGVTINELFKK